MAKITKDTQIGELANTYPGAIPVLLKYGLHCIGCHGAYFETIEQGAAAHGMDDKQIKRMVDEINDFIAKSKK